MCGDVIRRNLGVSGLCPAAKSRSKISVCSVSSADCCTNFVGDPPQLFNLPHRKDIVHTDETVFSVLRYLLVAQPVGCRAHIFLILIDRVLCYGEL